MKFCSIPSCSTISYGHKILYPRESSISFHGFPANVDIKKIWLNNISKKKGNESDPTPDERAFVCSLHFKNEDFFKGLTGFKRELKEDAVPTLFLKEPAPISEIIDSGESAEMAEKLKLKDIENRNLRIPDPLSKLPMIDCVSNNVGCGENTIGCVGNEIECKSKAIEFISSTIGHVDNTIDCETNMIDFVVNTVECETTPTVYASYIVDGESSTLDYVANVVDCETSTVRGETNIFDCIANTSDCETQVIDEQQDIDMLEQSHKFLLKEGPVLPFFPKDLQIPKNVFELKNDMMIDCVANTVSCFTEVIEERGAVEAEVQLPQQPIKQEPPDRMAGTSNDGIKEDAMCDASNTMNQMGNTNFVGDSNTLRTLLKKPGEKVDSLTPMTVVGDAVLLRRLNNHPCILLDKRNPIQVITEPNSEIDTTKLVPVMTTYQNLKRKCRKSKNRCAKYDCRCEVLKLSDGSGTIYNDDGVVLMELWYDQPDQDADEDADHLKRCGKDAGQLSGKNDDNITENASPGMSNLPQNDASFGLSPLATVTMNGLDGSSNNLDSGRTEPQVENGALNTDSLQSAAKRKQIHQELELVYLKSKLRKLQETVRTMKRSNASAETVEYKMRRVVTEAEKGNDRAHTFLNLLNSYEETIWTEPEPKQ